jgi:hypothetical protein
MRAPIRRKLSMAARALDFAAAHPVSDSSFAAVVKRLGDSVAKADATGMQETEGRTGERAALARRRNLKSILRKAQLRRLVRIAELASQDHPELKGKFVLPPQRLPNKMFLLAARSLLAAATAQKDVLVPLGLGDTFIADLTQATDQLEAATGGAHSGRTDHVAAAAEFSNLVRGCVRDVDVIGTFYRATMPADSELLVAWESASNVAGPFHHQTPTPPDSSPPPAPAPLAVRP